MATGGLPQRFADEMGTLLGPEFPKHLILAVSGGGDSMAMLYFAAPWARVMGIKIYVCTINHNLRSEAAQEVQLVADACAELGLFHQALDWHWDGQGNLQDAARRARIDLINRWRGSVNHVLMAHTLDDQAETFVMRLARGSGVDGLSSMSPKAALPNRSHRVPLLVDPSGPPWADEENRRALILRPLLDVTRAELRHFLATLRIPFADDPSNDDTKYDRVKVRQSWTQLESLGLTRERIAETAKNMARARDLLEMAALTAHRACLDPSDPGACLFDVTYLRDAFAAQPRESQLRMLSVALRFVSGAEYPPRLATLENALDRALGGAATTLHGGYIYPHKERLFVCPEFNTVRDLRPKDGYWRDHKVGSLDVRPLGESGAAQIRSQSDLPARVLWPTPAVWEEDRVLAAPRLGANPHWQAKSRATEIEHFLSAH